MRYYQELNIFENTESLIFHYLPPLGLTIYEICADCK